MKRYYRNFPKAKIDEVKVEVCQAIRRVAMREGWTQKQLAFYIGTSSTRAGHAVKQQVDELTLDQLFRYLAALYPKFRVHVSL